MQPTALIVDDDRLLRQMLADLLTEAGFRTCEAGDGEEGCRLAVEKAPDVILIDLVMPHMDGIEACRQLRSLPQFKYTPILMLTSRADRQGSVNPFQIGADDYINKPFDGPELIARVQGNLLRKKTVEQLERKASDYEVVREESAMLRYATSRLEEELRAKAVYEQLFENASEGLVAFDRKGELIFANRRAQEIVGYTMAELQGGNFARLLDIPASARFFRRRKQGSEVLRRFDVSARARSGDVRLLSVSLSEKPAADGLWVVAFRDVTDRRQMERDFQETRANLEAANRRFQEVDSARARFLNTAAHELRIPVTIVNGYCSLLREMGTDNLTEQQHEFLDAAVESSERLVDLLNNMLDLSRLDAGKMLVNIVADDLCTIVRRVCRDFRPLAQRSGLEVVVEPADACCAALFDVEMIERVLLNLLGNAVKFTPAGGRIRVLVEDGAGEVLVRVEDTGRGIPGERIPELFDEFSQLGRDDSRRGSGLGLSICKKIIDSHRGRIWAESTLGQGSRFTFTLPKPA